MCLKISNFRENSAKFLQMLQSLQNVARFQKIQLDNLVDFETSENAYLLAKIGADTTENEQHFAEILCQKLATTLRVHARRTGGRTQRGSFPS